MHNHPMVHRADRVLAAGFSVHTADLSTQVYNEIKILTRAQLAPEYQYGILERKFFNGRVLSQRAKAHIR